MSNFSIDSDTRISKKISPRIRNCLVYTDGKVTENNFINGIKKCIHDSGNKIVIKVYHENTSKLVKSCEENTDRDSVYREKWIMCDFDKVKNFDGIVASATSKDIQVAWSNPCLEIFFHAYFKKFPHFSSSQNCCDSFKNIYKAKTGDTYNKKNVDIYEKLLDFGDEKSAINLCKVKESQFNEECIYSPSKMNPCSTVYKFLLSVKYNS